MKYCKIILLLTLGFFLFSCEEEDNTPVSEISSFKDYTFVGIPEQIEVEESDSTYTIPFTFDDDQITDLHLEVHVVEGGSATDGVDFALATSTIDILALEKEGEFSFIIGKDYLIEGNESFFVEIVSTEINGLPLSQTVEIVIIDVAHNDELLLICDWGGTVSVDSVDYNLCDSVDLDIYLFDSDNANVYGYDGATASCPERIVMADLEDGTYSLVANLWISNVPADSTEIVSYPVTVNFIQGDVQNESATQSVESAVNSLDIDYYGGGSVNKLIAEITVAGDSFTWVMQ